MTARRSGWGSPGKPSPDGSDREYEEYAGAAGGSRQAGEEPDVLLDVPALKVDEIELEVDDLRVQVSVQAELADMVKLNVGVEVNLGKVKLGIKGVEAQAMLKVRLDNVRAIFEETLAAIDRNPQLFERLAGGIKRSDEPMESATRPGGEGRRTSRRVVDETGDVVQTVRDEAGEVLEENAWGSFADLPPEEEYLDGEGRIVSRVRDDAGNVLEEEIDEEGNAVGVLDFIEADETFETGIMAARGEIEATTAAWRKARQLGLDLASIEGTGSGGRILVRDVERAAKNEG